MKVRSVANGNIIDLPEGHGLILAGIYVPVDSKTDPPPAAPVPAAGVDVPSVPAREGALVQPQAEIMTTAHLEPAAREAPAAKKQPRKSPTKRRKG